MLNKALENAEKLPDALHDPANGKKPCNYRKRARKNYLKYIRSRKQFNYLKRDLEFIDSMLALGRRLTDRQTEQLNTLRKIYEQQMYMYDVHSVPNHIVSVSRPFVCPIMRGKAGKPIKA